MARVDAVVHRLLDERVRVSARTMWSTSLSAVVVTPRAPGRARMLPPPPTFSLRPRPSTRSSCRPPRSSRACAALATAQNHVCRNRRSLHHLEERLLDGCLRVKRAVCGRARARLRHEIKADNGAGCGGEIEAHRHLLPIWPLSFSGPLLTFLLRQLVSRCVSHALTAHLTAREPLLLKRDSPWRPSLLVPPALLHHLLQRLGLGRGRT